MKWGLGLGLLAGIGIGLGTGLFAPFLAQVAVLTAALVVIAFASGEAVERERAKGAVATVRLYWDGTAIEGNGQLTVEHVAGPAPRPDAKSRLP